MIDPAAELASPYRHPWNTRLNHEQQSICRTMPGRTHAVRLPNSELASAVAPTQAEAIDRCVKCARSRPSSSNAFPIHRPGNRINGGSHSARI